MLNDADAFLDAIWAAPNDDTPRLVYADWLEENGHADLGRFIRAQCLIEHLPNDNPQRVVLREVEKKAWAALKKRWGAVFTSLGMKKHEFRRGFYTGGIRCTAATYFAQYPALWPWFPLETLHLTGRAAAEPFARHPDLFSYLTFFGIDGSVDRELPIVLATACRFRRLYWLSLGADLGDVARQLVDAPWLAGLVVFAANDRTLLAGSELVPRGYFFLPSPRPKPTDRPTVREQLIEYLERRPPGTVV